MISANILSEQQNVLGDLLVSSRKSILSIYLSKLCAVSTVTLVARLIFLTVTVLWFWNIDYPVTFASIGLSLPLGKILSFYAVHEVIYMPFLLLCYTAMPVFVSVITNVPAAGAVWNVGFYLLGMVVTPLANTNSYLPPLAMDNYLMTYNYIDTPEYMKALQAGLYPTVLGGEVPPTLPEALTVYIAWIVFSLALLIASYFILKRRYRT